MECERAVVKISDVALESALPRYPPREASTSEHDPPPPPTIRRNPTDPTPAPPRASALTIAGGRPPAPLLSDSLAYERYELLPRGFAQSESAG